jgi:hypothetical protein
LGSEKRHAIISIWRSKNRFEVVDKGIANLIWHELHNIIFIFNGNNRISFPTFENGMVKEGSVSVSILDP